MKKNRVKTLLCRVLAITALAVSLVVLPSSTSSAPSDCCKTCLNLFYQCDGTTIVCCGLYNRCLQQCPVECPSCPDE